MLALFDNFYVRRVVSFFLAIIDIRYWFGDHYNSRVWDEWLWKALNNPIEIDSEYIVFVMEEEVWIENYPYSSGCPYPFPGGFKDFYPTILTRYKLKAKAEAALMRDFEEYLKQRDIS